MVQQKVPMDGVRHVTGNGNGQDVTRLARGAGISVVGKLVGRGTHFVGQILLARFLGPAAFGLYALGWTILRISSLLIPLGLDKGIIHFGSKFHRERPFLFNNVLRQSLLISLFSGFVWGSFVYVLAPWLASVVFKEPSLASILRLFAYAVPTVAVMKVCVAATQVSQRMKYSVLAEDLGQPIIGLLLFLLFWWAGWHLRGAVIATVLSFVAALLLAFLFVRHLFTIRWRRDGDDIFPARQLLAFSLPAAMTGVFINLIIWSDRLFIGYYLPAFDVGIYQAISQSSVLFVIILSGFNAIFAPMIADLYHKGEMARLEELFRVTTKWGLYVSLPLFLVICIAPRELLWVLFGEEYVVGVAPLLILSAGQLVNLGSGAVGYMLIMTGHQNRWFVSTIVAFVANFVLNAVLIPLWGNVGAATATAVATSALYFWLV